MGRIISDARTIIVVGRRDGSQSDHDWISTPWETHHLSDA